MFSLKEITKITIFVLDVSIIRQVIQNARFEKAINIPKTHMWQFTLKINKTKSEEVQGQ